MRVTLSDLASLARHPRINAELWRDVLSTKRALSRVLPSENKGEGEALLVALTDSPYEIKLLCMFGLFLQMEGVSTELLLASPQTSRSKRYAASFGITSISDIDDFSRDRSEVDFLAATAMKAAMQSPQTFRSYAVKGWWAGPQVLAKLLTAQQPTISALDLSSPATVEAIYEVAERFAAVRKWLTGRSFSLAVCIEANGPLHGPVIDALIESDCPVIQVTQPLRANQIFLKRFTRANRRHHPASVAPETLATLASRDLSVDEDTLLQLTLEERYSAAQTLFSGQLDLEMQMDREQFCSHFQLQTEKPIVVLFPHILWDANLFYGDDLFEDYASWLVQTVRVLSRLDQVSVLIKLHPANQWKYQGPQDSAESRLLSSEGLIPSPNLRLVPPSTPVSTWCFLLNADYGITVRGSVGFEMPCFGKPVLTAGTGRYSNLGFTVDSATQEEYLEKLETIAQIPQLNQHETSLARKHAFLAAIRRPWTMTSFQTIESLSSNHGHPLKRNLHTEIEATEELGNASDVRLWLNWALHSASADYLGS